MKGKRFNYCKWMVLVSVLAVVDSFGQTADSLSHYLEIAARNNPGVKADFRTYEASLKKVPQAGAYQDPQLEMGFFLEPMELVEGRQVAQFQLMQMFPWFGTKKSAQTEATHMAKMAYEKFRETRDQLYLDVYTQWYVLCSLKQQWMNNQENRKLLTQLEELALKRYSSPGSGSSSLSPAPAPAVRSNPASGSGGGMGGGMSSMGSGTNALPSGQGGMSSMTGSSGGMSSSSPGMSDVLRIRLELLEIDDNLESLVSKMKAEKAKFNALLNRSADSEVEIPNAFVQETFLFDIPSTLSLITQQNPMLGMISEEGNSYQAKAEMDKKMSYPMFGVGLQYMLINKKPVAAGDGMDMNAGMNGKDMIMPMVSLSIPIYRNKYKAQQLESKFLVEANKEKYTNTKNALESELYGLQNQLDDAVRKISLYKKQSDLAQTTYKLIVQEFTVGKNDLSNVIQVQRQLLGYQLKTAEAIANYNTMVASVRKLISSKNSM